MPVPTRTPLLTLLRLEQAHVADIKATLLQSSKEIERQLTRVGADKVVTRTQLKAQKAAIDAYLQQDFQDIQASIKAGQKAAAAAASRVTSRFEDDLLSVVMTQEARAALATSEALRAANGVEAALRRMEGTSYKPLSSQVYKTYALSKGRVDDLVNRALVKGMTWKELAKEVSHSINPNVPGGVSYAANRLARTEINNAFHASAAKRYDESAIVDKVEWHLSSSHPEGDICDDLQANSPYGKKSVPQKPHPHCYCFITPHLPDEDEFIDNLFAGKYGDEPWAAKVSQPKVEKLLPDLPDDAALDKMSTAAVKREYDTASKEYWAYSRNWKGTDAALYKDPTYLALKGRYDFWSKQERARASAARARAAAAKAAKKAEAAKLGLTPAQVKAQKRINDARNAIAKAGMPRFKNDLVKPRNLVEARRGANPRGPGWALEDKRPKNKLSFEEVVAARDYQINCTRVAATMEMRMRGWDVSATGAGEKLAFTKNEGWTVQNWIDPKTGKPRSFKKVDTQQEMDTYAEQFPEGSRFFITGTWKNGGGHIWNAEIRNGKLDFVEGQVQEIPPGQVKASYVSQLNYAPESSVNKVSILRVDDLEPTELILGTPRSNVPSYIEPNPLR